MKPSKEHKLLDYLKANCGFKNDAAIAEAWQVTYAVISRIRTGHIQIKDKYILRIYDTTKLTIPEIRDLLK